MTTRLSAPKSDPRITELMELAAAEGLTLPYPPEMIARLEDGGAVVDLVTGATIVNGADVRYRLTLLGEANAIVWEVQP
jgi:hypothetical protein